MESKVITPLDRPVSNRLRSSVMIPTFPQALSELVQNALDAGSSRIECWIDLSPENESIRVQDNGHGIDEEGMKRVGERYRVDETASSKSRAGHQLTPVSGFGFRGEALSSLAAICLMEITTKTESSRHTYTKVLRGSDILVSGRSNRAIHGPHGTTVVVKDLFHNIPVRQASLQSISSHTTIAGCRKIIESLAIVHPTVRWTLWEERYSGGTSLNGPKKIINVHPGKSSLEIYRSIFGRALLERVQSIRVTSGSKRIDGFLSLHGDISKTSQYLYVNRFPLGRGDLHAAITKRFAASRFSFMTQDDIEDPSFDNGRRRSPRRSERHPIYVLNITIPPEELDAAYDPKKTVLGFHEPSGIQTLVLAVVDEYLKRNGFSNPEPQKRPASVDAASPTTRASKRPAKEKNAVVPLTQHFAQSVDRSMGPPKGVPEKRSQANPAFGKSPIRPYQSLPCGTASATTTREQRRDAWIADLVSDMNTGVLPTTPSGLPSFRNPTNRPPSSAGRHRCSHTFGGSSTTTADVNFTVESLRYAKVIGQVDKKFIACLLATKANDGTRSLVLIDQHAADERVSVEIILRELCEGFINDNVQQTEVKDISLVLTRYEAIKLSSPSTLEILGRWGISVDVPAPSFSDYVQVQVTAVPSVLVHRLGRKEASELTRLVRQYLTEIPPTIEIRSLVNTVSGNDRWQMAQRWMPKEMLDLANSKACRNAIMFEDTLDLDQCQRLVHRLSKTNLPWICAHGRPSLVPLGLVPNAEAGLDHKRERDWTTWGH